MTSYTQVTILGISPDYQRKLDCTHEPFYLPSMLMILIYLNYTTNVDHNQAPLVTMIHLPFDIWYHIILQCGSRDLRTLCLVSSCLREFLMTHDAPWKIARESKQWGIPGPPCMLTPRLDLTFPQMKERDYATFMYGMFCSMDGCREHAVAWYPHLAMKLCDNCRSLNEAFPAILVWSSDGARPFEFHFDEMDASGRLPYRVGSRLWNFPETEGNYNGWRSDIEKTLMRIGISVCVAGGKYCSRSIYCVCGGH